ncbi:MAG: hypothetical protein GF418_12995 [Chitinivibrionales bacterium]|nr:hypothetical protein [Chitinivibrionales bacterium]MBD3396535.1 hypothetical protein [Chitinivibrionales bacterium]
MKKLLRYAGLAFLALLGILGAAVFLVQNADWLHQTVLARVNSAIPGTISISELRCNVFDARVEIDSLVVTGPDGDSLLGCDHLYLDAALLRLLRRRLLVERAVLLHPRAHLALDSAGSLTLLGAFVSPGRRTAASDTAATPFHVTVRDLRLNRGYVTYSSETDSFRAEAGGLSLRGKGDTRKPSAAVSLDLDTARIRQRHGQIRIRDLKVSARASASRIDSVDITLRTDSSDMHLTGNIRDLPGCPRGEIDLRIDVALDEVSRITGAALLMTGRARLMLNANGELADPHAELALVYDGGNIGGYDIDHGELSAVLVDRRAEISGLKVGLGSGNISGSGVVDARYAFPEGFTSGNRLLPALRYSLDLDASALDIQRFAGDWSGTLHSYLACSGEGISPESLSLDVVLDAGVRNLSSSALDAPLTASVHCSSSVKEAVAHFYQVNARLGENAMEARGLYRFGDSTISADFDADLRDLAGVLAPLGVNDVRGAANVEGAIRGTARRPGISCSLDGRRLAFRDISLGNIGAALRLTQSGSTIIDSCTLIHGDSHLFLSGSAMVLRNGKPVPADKLPFSITLRADHLALGDFVDSLAGNISLHANIEGTPATPSGALSLRAHALDLGVQTFQEVLLESTMDGGRIGLRSFRITLAGNQHVDAHGWISMDDSFSVSLSTEGISLGALDAVHQRADSLSGTLAFTLSGYGPLDNPGADGTITMSDLAVRDTPLDAIRLQLGMKSHRISLKGKAIAAIDASYDLGSKAVTAALDFDSTILDPYLALTGQPDLAGMLDGTIDVAGPADTVTSLLARADIRRLSLDYKDLGLLAATGLRASMTRERFIIPETRLTVLQKGYLQIRSEGMVDGPYHAVTSGRIPLAVARYFTDDLPAMDGTVSFDGTFHGTRESADLDADIRLNDIGMDIPGTVQRLHSMNGHVVADRYAIRIAELSGRIDEGTVSMTGMIALRDLLPSSIEADIALSAVPVSVPDVADMVFDANLAVRGTPDTSSVRGALVLAEGLYYKDVSIRPLESVRKRERGESPPRRDIEVPFLRGMQFDVTVDAQTPFRVDNNLAQLVIAPDLHLRGGVNQPVLSGRAQVESGTITYRKRTFTVEKGVVDFVSPYRIEPSVDIRGTVPVRDWTITLSISGTPDDLVFRLESDDPGLEDQDLLALLVFGKTTAELQTDIEDRAIARTQSTEQLFAELLASTFSDDIRKVTGFDVLQVETGGDAGEGTGGITLTVGKKLTKRLTTKYSVEARSGDVVQKATAEYRIIENLQISGYQDTKGVYGGEMQITWEAR